MKKYRKLDKFMATRKFTQRVRGKSTTVQIFDRVIPEIGYKIEKLGLDWVARLKPCTEQQAMDFTPVDKE